MVPGEGASLAERIRAQRIRCGLTQERLAEIVGVSRQAVTKWETGVAAPGTENLFRLAGALGTTVDLLLPQDETAGTPDGRPLAPCRMAAAEKRAARLAAGKRRACMALAVVGGYLLAFVMGNLLCARPESASLLGLLLGRGAERPYLFGWLLGSGLYWIAMAMTAGLSLLGAFRLSCSALAGFLLGWLLGEAFGANPAGAAYGFGHYGWAMWGCVFLFSLAMGTVLERLARRGMPLRSKGFLLWCAAFLGGAAFLCLLVFLGMPRVDRH